MTEDLWVLETSTTATFREKVGFTCLCCILFTASCNRCLFICLLVCQPCPEIAYISLISRLPSLQYQSQKGTQIVSICEKQWVFGLSGEMAGDAESLLKGTTQNFVCSHLPWALAEGGQSGLEMLEENLGLVVLGRELKEQLPGFQG